MSRLPRRYRLRHLFGVLLIVATLAGLVGMKMRSAAKQADAVASILQRGGHVRYGYELQGNPAPFGAAPLRRVLGIDFFNDVEVVEFIECDFEPDDCRHFEALSKLHRIYFWDTPLSDDCMERLGALDLPELTKIEMHLTFVSDRGIGFLSSMKQLRVIDVNTEEDLSKEGVRRLREALPDTEIYFHNYIK